MDEVKRIRPESDAANVRAEDIFVLQTPVRRRRKEQGEPERDKSKTKRAREISVRAPLHLVIDKFPQPGIHRDEEDGTGQGEKLGMSSPHGRITGGDPCAEYSDH